MKTNALKIAAASVMILTAPCILFLFPACEKEADMEAATLLRPPTKEDPTENKVLEFLASTKDPTQKSGEMIPAEEGLWLLEAALNYALVNPFDKGTEIHEGTIRIPFPAGNSSLPASLLASIFSRITDSLQLLAFNSGIVVPALDRLDLERNNTTLNDTIFIHYCFTGGSPPTGYLEPFGQDDWWYYGMGSGRCNGFSGGTGKDATTELLRKAYANMAYPTGHSFFTDLETVIVRNPLQLPGNGPDPNYCFFPVFYNTNNPPYDNSFHDCLCPDEMNYYYDNLLCLQQAYKPLVDPTNPSLGTKDFAGYFLIPSVYINNNGFLVIEHILFLTYGISHTAIHWTAYHW